MRFENRLNEAYKEYAEFQETTIEEAKEIIKSDWGDMGLRGYGIFSSDDTKALHIEKIDEVGVFESDLDAAKQAKKDGVKLIPYNEQPHKYPHKYYRFIDTPENREILKMETER